ncbi:MAG: CBS domain-containing protein [Acidobacteriota bacterium]|jgi:acetoin utilization protein AcuB
MPHARVRDFMTTEPVTLHDDDRLREAVEMVMVRRIRHIPILDAQQRLVGIVTDRDIKRTLPSPLVSSAREEYEALLETTAISRVMSPDPMTVDADSDVADAVELLVQNRIGGLPVMENDTLVGVFTERDALRGYVELLQALQKAEAAG